MIPYYPRAEDLVPPLRVVLGNDGRIYSSDRGDWTGHTDYDRLAAAFKLYAKHGEGCTRGQFQVDCECGLRKYERLLEAIKR